jgi:hypothetical protein
LSTPYLKFLLLFLRKHCIPTIGANARDKSLPVIHAKVGESDLGKGLTACPSPIISRVNSNDADSVAKRASTRNSHIINSFHYFISFSFDDYIISE